MSLDPTIRLWTFRVVGAGKGGLLFPVHHPPESNEKELKAPAAQ